jgi:hypothetical protein
MNVKINYPIYLTIVALCLMKHHLMKMHGLVEIHSLYTSLLQDVLDTGQRLASRLGRCTYQRGTIHWDIIAARFCGFQSRSASKWFGLHSVEWQFYSEQLMGEMWESANIARNNSYLDTCLGGLRRTTNFCQNSRCSGLVLNLGLPKYEAWVLRTWWRHLLWWFVVFRVLGLSYLHLNSI